MEREPVSVGASPRNCGRCSRTKTGLCFSAGVRGQLAQSHLEHGEALSLHRRARSRRYGLRRSCVGGGRAGESQVRAHLREHPDGWRFQLFPRRLLDGGAPSHSAVEHHAQQPRLSPGSDVRRADGQRPQSRRRAGWNRHEAVGSGFNYASIAKGYGCMRRSHHDPKELAGAFKRGIER
jgi:hypothetical protein